LSGFPELQGVTPILWLSRNELNLSVTPQLHFSVLADKSYAGAVGENSAMFYPVKHQELSYRKNPEDSKQRNANLSRKRAHRTCIF
jgi:hypothetical protein